MMKKSPMSTGTKGTSPANSSTTSEDDLFEGIEAGSHYNMESIEERLEQSWNQSDASSSVALDAAAPAPSPFNQSKKRLSEVSLSTVSRAYDRGNKGYLDEEERELRRLDTKNLGYLDSHKAVRMLHDLKEAQKTNITNRKIIIALSIFAILLALSNVGTSFAAAILAKDSDVKEGQLVDKASGKRLATTPREIVIKLEEDRPTVVDGRMLQEKNTTITKTKAIEIFSELCSNIPANMDYEALYKTPGASRSAWTCQFTNDIHIQMVHCGSQQVITHSFLERIPFLSTDRKILSVYFYAIRGGVITGVYGIKCNTDTVIETCNVGNVAPPTTTTELYCTSPCSPFGSCTRPWFCPETQVCDYDSNNCYACKSPTA